MKIKEELRKLTKRKDIWREGEYLDLWSVPHFLSGALLACFIYLLHLPFLYATLLATLLLVAYEVFEIYVLDIHESEWNRNLDVVVGLASFIPLTLVIFDWKFIEVFVLGLCVGVPDGILSYIGWTVSQKGILFEKKITREYEILKTRFLEKMKERKLKRQEKRAAKLALKQLKKQIKLDL